MAEILEGLLLINQTDVYARFGAFLAETGEDRHDNYDSLLAPPALKQQAEVSIRGYRFRYGVRMPDILTQTYEARDITLRFAIVASNDVSFFTRYASFVKFLKEGDDGWLALHLTDVGLKFRVYMTGFSDYSQLAPFGKGEVAATFSVKFRRHSNSLRRSKGHVQIFKKWNSKYIRKKGI